MNLPSILENEKIVILFYTVNKLSTKGMHYTQIASLDKLNDKMIEFVISGDWDAMTSFAANVYRKAKRESMQNWVENAWICYINVFLLLEYDITASIDLLTYN